MGSPAGRVSSGCAAAAVLWWSCADLIVAAPIVGRHDWDIGEHVWTSESGLVPLPRPPAGGAAGGSLQIAFPPSVQGDAGDEWDESTKVAAANLFIGDWTTEKWVEHDFWARDKAPAGAETRLRWATNAYRWAYADSEAVATQEWGRMFSPLEDAADWNAVESLGAAEELYLAGLSSADWIGVHAWRGGTDPLVHGLDESKLEVPEPSQAMFLLAALAASGAAVRRRRPRAGVGRDAPLMVR
jgi:hypothetical protein